MNGRMELTTFFGGLAVIASILVQINEVLPALVVLMAISLMMGIVRAAIDERLSAHDVWVDAARKAATLLLVLAVSAAVRVGGFEREVVSYVAIFFCAQELLLTMEHAAALGVPIPERLKRMLASQGRGDDKRTGQAQ